MTDQLQLVPLPERPLLAVEYARCYLRGRVIGGHYECAECHKDVGRVEEHGERWLCKGCHIRAHGRNE